MPAPTFSQGIDFHGLSPEGDFRAVHGTALALGGATVVDGGAMLLGAEAQAAELESPAVSDATTQQEHGLSSTPTDGALTEADPGNQLLGVGKETGEASKAQLTATQCARTAAPASSSATYEVMRSKVVRR